MIEAGDRGGARGIVPPTYQEESGVASATRAEIVDLLHACGVFTLQEHGIEEAFLAGEADFPIGELRMDSLSAMEFCIALEERWQLSVAPEDVGSFGTLGQLAAILAGAHAD